MDKEIKTNQIDFEKNQSMAFTSPLAYRFYRKQEKQVENWRDLYSAVLSDLARGHSRLSDRNGATEYCFTRMPEPVK